MKYRPKIGRSRNNAVSDIIGNLLILAITVTLFSGVLFYVNSMPGPQDQTYADYSYEQPLYFGVESGDVYVWINVTMGGGQSLVNESTVMVVTVNDVITRKSLMDGGIGDIWVTGETWSCKIFNALPDDEIYLMILDTGEDNVVWQATLTTGQVTQEYEPIITERGILQYPIYDNTGLTFYCKVVDFNSNLNLNSVYVDLSGLGLAVSYKLTYDPGTGTFWSASEVIDAKLAWNGKTVTFNATDLTGHEGTADLRVTVFKDEVGNGTTSNNNGTAPGNLSYSGFQGFNIFELNDWLENGYDATPVRKFARGESVIIVVSSIYLKNTNSVNSLEVINTTTKIAYPAVSSPTVTFQSYDFVSGYYVYTAIFNTTNLPAASSYYYLKANIKDSWIPNNQFIMNDMIFVTVPWGSQEPAYPMILTYKDSGYTILCDDFSTYDPSNNIIYVEVLNYYGEAWDPYTGDVEIRDFFWNAQLKASPAIGSSTGLSTWNGPISNLWQVAQTAPPGKYHFIINLANVTEGHSWIGGNNAYALLYDMFKAGSEKSLMSTIINIDAPAIKLDIVVGSQPTVNSRWATANALFYYANENQWYPPTLMETGSTDKKSYSPYVYMVRAGDINGDLKSDLLVVLQDQSTNIIYLNVYLNLESSTSSGWLKTTVAILSAVPKDIAIGNIDYDNDADLVVAYGSSIYIYRNDGAWSYSTISLTYVNKILVADMDPAGTAGNDPARAQDIIVSRTSGGVVTILKNTFGDGTSWAQNTLSTSGTASVDNWALSDINVTGSVLNTYLNTLSPSQDDGVYERITENTTWRYVEVYPTSESGNDTVTDPLTQLQAYEISSNDPYTLPPGVTAGVNEWDSTSLTYPLAPISVTLKVRYFTDSGYATGDSIVWNRGGTDVSTIKIQDTGGEWVNVTYTMTGYGTLSSITDADLRITNTDSSASINFDYWLINVTWSTGDELEHIWKFDLPVPSSGTHAFGVYALRNNSVDGDNFVFSYSTNYDPLTGVGTWTPLTSATIATSGDMLRYTGTIPATVTGTTYIRVVDTDRTLTASSYSDWIRVGQMKVTTTVLSTTVGTSILAMNLADMDSDGDNDIVVCSLYTSTTGRVSVFYNDGNIFENIVFCQATSSTLLRTTVSIAAGSYFDPYGDPWLDIAICTENNIYFIKQTADGIYSGLSAFKFSYTAGDYLKMVSADVDGNNRDDLLAITSTGYIFLYANYRGLESATGWQIYTIDSLGYGLVNDIDVSDFQSA